MWFLVPVLLIFLCADELQALCFCAPVVLKLRDKLPLHGIYVSIPYFRKVQLKAGFSVQHLLLTYSCVVGVNSLWECSMQTR